MRTITVRLSEGLLGAVDEVRGLVPRERWIREVLRREVGGVEESVADLQVEANELREERRENAERVLWGPVSSWEAKSRVWDSRS